MKHVYFLDRWSAKKLSLDVNTDCLISVNDTETEAHEMGYIHAHMNEEDAILLTVFSDIDNANQFSISQAKAAEIVEFVNKNQTKQNFYVHCFAGVSRSAAIAKYINDILVLDDMCLEGYSMYNRYVYNMLMGVSGNSLKAYYEALEQQERTDPYGQ